MGDVHVYACVCVRKDNVLVSVCVCAGKRFLDGRFYRARADNDGRRTDNAMTLHTHARQVMAGRDLSIYRDMRIRVYVCTRARARVYGRIVIVGREGGLMYIKYTGCCCGVGVLSLRAAREN